MPPIKKYSKDKIVETALEIAKKEGFEKLNARRIAKELKSSVNPIFNNFKNMDELKDEVYKEIYGIYKNYMNNGKKEENSYRGMGVGYIKFAKDYPEFFKIIFMKKYELDAENFILADAEGNDVIKEGQKLTGLSFEEQKKFHVRVWIFTHGIACLVATKTITIEDEEIVDLLQNTVREMLIGYLKRKENA
ncbi:MAG: TetR/AcrR family transcriptional regulator [Bacilli bacterium]|nr:TetR/AcrR family transcriptional regulator [Bacilli bacterium]